MTDATQATASAPKSADDKESDRKATHEWLSRDGDVVDDILDGEGYRFTLVGVDEPVDVMLDEIGEKGVRMLALFGAKTKATNEASGVRNNAKIKGTPKAGPTYQVAAVKEFFTRLATGEWSAPSEGGGPVKIDKDKLAQAICTVLVQEGKKSQADIDSGHKAKVRQKLEDDPIFVRKSRSVPQVATEYAKLAGQTTGSLDDLANI